MSDFWHAAAGWAAQTAVAGAVVLGIGWAWLRRVESPARRQRLAGWTVRAAVLVAALAVLPGWVKVPVPAWARPAVPTAAAVYAPPAATTPMADADGEPPAGVTDTAEEVAAADRPTAAGPVTTPSFASASAAVPAGRFRVTTPPDQIPAVPRMADEVIDHQWDAAALAAPPPDVPDEAFLAVAQVADPLTPRGDQLPPDAPPAARDRVTEIAPLVLLPYAVIALAGLLQLAAGQLALARMRRGGVPAPAWLQAAFDDLAFGIPFGPRLYVTDAVASPVCFGVFRPTVLIPKKLVVSATREQLRWVLAHELDHLRRGDTWTGVWVSVARAIYFFVPWFWVVRRELALSQEYLADAAAAAAGGQPVDYAAFLVDLSSARPGESRPARHPLGAAGVRAGQSDLFRRVTMLLNAKPGLEHKAPRGWSVLTAGGVLSAAVLLSGVTWAADDEPKKVVVEQKKDGDKKKATKEGEVVIEVVVDDETGGKKTKKVTRDGEVIVEVVIDDEKADADKKKAVKDEEKKKAEVRRTGAKAEEIAALKKAVEAAAKKGDMDAVRSALDKLEKAAAAGSPRAVVIDGKMIAPVPPVPGAPPAPGARFAPLPPGAFAWRAAGDEAVKDLEKAIDGLKKAAEQVKDQPEARAALEKSIAEFRKKIAEAKSKGELAKPALTPAVPGQFHFDWAANKERIAEQMKKGMEKAQQNFEKQMERLKDNPEALAEMKKAMEEQKKAMEQALKGLADEDGVWRIAPQGARGGQGGAWQVAPAAEARGVRLGVVPEAVPEALAEQLDLPKGHGVLLAQVIKGTPAEKAGFKANDILMTIGGKDIEGGEGTLSKVLAGLKSGAPLDAVVIRKGKKVTVKGVTLAEVEKPQPRTTEVKPAKPAQVEKPARPDRPARPGKPARPGEESDSGKKAGKSQFNSTTVRVDDNEFSIRATSDEARYTITGKMEDGKPVPSSIAIRGSDNKTQEYSSLEKVPAEHRAAVKQLLGNIGGGTK